LSAIQLASHTITNKSIESANNIGGILALEASKYRDGLIIVIGPAEKKENQLTSGRLYANKLTEQPQASRSARMKLTSRMMAIIFRNSLGRFDHRSYSSMRDLVEDFQSAALREPTWPAIAAGPFVSH
jgi:hypothetical protein